LKIAIMRLGRAQATRNNSIVSGDCDEWKEGLSNDFKFFSFLRGLTLELEASGGSAFAHHSWGQFREVGSSPQDLPVGLLSHRTRENAQRRGSQGMLDVVRGLVDGMKPQHASLRQEIEGLQKRIERSRNL
jgi:hypothetical protein